MVFPGLKEFECQRPRGPPFVDRLRLFRPLFSWLSCEGATNRPSNSRAVEKEERYEENLDDRWASDYPV